MLSKENINYQITREERSVYIDIFLDNTSSNKYGGGVCEFACYFLKDGNIVEKKMYQLSGKFFFDLLGEGEYSFTIFVRNKTINDNEPIIKQTEKIEIRQYILAAVADEEVTEICSSINGLTLNKYDSILEDITEKIIFLDLIHMLECMQTKCNDEIVIIISSEMSKYIEQRKMVILFIRYIDGFKEELIKRIIQVGIRLNVKLIDTHQIFKRNENGIITYENYDTYCRSLRNQLKPLLEESKTKLFDLDIRVNIVNDQLVFKMTGIQDSLNVLYNYYILKDGKVIYKHKLWEYQNEFSYQLTENGIYMVQGFAKYNLEKKIIKSHTKEYFKECYKQKFDRLCYESKYTQKNKADFFAVSEPFADFAVIQSRNIINDIDLQDFQFYTLNSFSDKKNYLLSNKVPVEQHGKLWVCSGLISSHQELLYGNEMLKTVNILDGNKETGQYCIVEMGDSRICISCDYFTFNRIFYYYDSDVIVCSNRYHLLLLVVEKLGITLRLDVRKALMTLSSVRLPYLTQNMCAKMDMEGVKQCSNSYDIVLDKNGLSFQLNEYGKVLQDISTVNEKEYREELEKGCSEIIENINTIVKTEEKKNFIIDLSGGLDSRIVYSAALCSEINRGKAVIYSKDVSGSNDLSVAIMINNLYDLPWDTLTERRKRFDQHYNEIMQRSLFMGLYYSHNLIGGTSENDMCLRMTGACGEILMRPYTVRKFLNTKATNITDKREFLDYILKNYSEHIIVDYTASAEFVDYMCEEFKNYGNCGFMETMDRVYLEHRHGYHFEGGLDYCCGIQNLKPLQSKTLFKLHHKIFDLHKSIKLQLDIQNYIEPYLGAIIYDSEEDNTDREKLRDILYFKKEYHRYLKINDLNGGRNEYDVSVRDKQKNIIREIHNTEYLQTDFYYEMLDAWYMICNYSPLIKEKIGVAVWHYIQIHNADSERKTLRYLYNKIMSLKDQIDIFQN